MDPLSGASSVSEGMQSLSLALNKKEQIGDAQMSLTLLESAVQAQESISASASAPGANPSDRLGSTINIHA